MIASLLVAKNFIDSLGRIQFLSKIFILDFLHYFTLCFLLENSAPPLFATFYSKYSFFACLAGLSSGIFSWERDVFSGLGKSYILTTKWKAYSSRIVLSCLLCSPFLCFLFVSILLTSNYVMADCLNFLFLAAASNCLGIGIGFFFGFGKEKAINNSLHLSVWVLAIGSGFSSDNTNFITDILLPTSPLNTSLSIEFTKSLVMIFGSYILIRLGSRPRSKLF